MFYDDRDTEKLYVLTPSYLYVLNQDLEVTEPRIFLGVDPNNFECDYMAEVYSKKNEL